MPLRFMNTIIDPKHKINPIEVINTHSGKERMLQNHTFMNEINTPKFTRIWFMDSLLFKSETSCLDKIVHATAAKTIKIIMSRELLRIGLYPFDVNIVYIKAPNQR